MLKRTIALILLSMVLISSTSCTPALLPQSETEEPESQTEEVTSAEKVTVPAPNEADSSLVNNVVLGECPAPILDPTPAPDPSALVKDPLTWEDIEAIPVAKASMTSDELRQICADFFRLMQTFRWTPSQDFNYNINNTRPVNGVIKEGQIYGGLPYRTGKGNVYMILDFYDSATGVLSVPAPSEQQKFAELIGNHCSYGANWAWSRVSNTITGKTTAYMIASKGFVPLGNYRYDTSLKQWSNDVLITKTVCANNGEQTMYQSYAKMKLADGMVHSANGTGHVQFVAAEPVIVRNGDGTINGDKSYVLYIDQGSSWNTFTYPDGSTATIQGEVDVKITFKQMFKTGYLPFTLAEFQGTDAVEKSAAYFNGKVTETGFSQMYGRAVLTNYSMVYLQAFVMDAQGNVLLEKKLYADKPLVKYLEVRNLLVKEELEPYFNGDYYFRLDCLVSTGETHTVAQGKLVE